MTSASESLLERACRRRDLFQVQALLRDRADPNHRNQVGETPLLEAAAAGDLNVVVLLLGHTADPVIRARPGMEMDADRGVSPSVRALFELFTKNKNMAPDVRSSILSSLPVPLDPGALSKARVRLGIGGVRAGIRQGGMAPIDSMASGLCTRCEDTADHEVKLHDVADPSRPVLILNPLWQKPSALVLMLHGMLQSGRMMDRLARDLSRVLPFARFIAPTAPMIPSPWGIGPVWFDMINSNTSLPGREYMQASLTEVHDILEMARQQGIPAEKTIVLGFSAGGILACLLARNAPQHLRGLVLLGTSGMAKLGPEVLPGCSRLEGLHVLQCHGKSDTMAGFDSAYASVENMKALGCDVRLSPYLDVGHVVSDDMIEEVKMWLVQQLPEPQEGCPDNASHQLPSNNAVDSQSNAPLAPQADLPDNTSHQLPSNNAVDSQRNAPPAHQADLPPASNEETRFAKDTDHVPVQENALDQATALALAHDLPLNACRTALLLHNGDANSALDFLSETTEGNQICQLDVTACEINGAMARLLAHDIPIEACVLALQRYSYDPDEALDFLEDTEEGQKIMSSVSPQLPLASAAHMGDVDEVKRLLRDRADPNACNSWGETPLFFAARQASTALVALLLLGRADPCITSKCSQLTQEAHDEATRSLIQLAQGVNVNPSAQTIALGALDTCTRFLVHNLLISRGIPIVAPDVLSQSH